MSREILRSALSTGVVCAILLLLVELARVVLSIIGLIAMVQAGIQPLRELTLMLSYAMTAAGLVIGIVLLVTFSSAKRELDRQ